MTTAPDQPTPPAYDASAKQLAAKFRANDTKFAISDAVRAAGPTV